MDAGIFLLANTALPPTLPSASQASRSLDRLHKTVNEFEEVFLAQMLQPMLSGLTPEEPFGGGPGEEMWQSMLVKEYGKAIVARGGIGIADAVMREALLAHEHGKELPR